MVGDCIVGFGLSCVTTMRAVVGQITYFALCPTLFPATFPPLPLQVSVI